MDNGNNAPSRHAAPAFGMARLHYKIKDVEFQFYTQFSAGFTFEQLNIEEQQKPAIYAIDEQGRPFSPSWYTLNFKTQFALSSQLFVTAGIENLLDVRYKTYSSGLVAPGRNFVISLRGSF
jgi:hemoglobin/transferrin/lactoferrin receptor protein